MPDIEQRTEDDRFFRFTIDVNLEGDDAAVEAQAAIEVVSMLLNQQKETHVIAYDFAEIVGKSWYSVSNHEEVTSDEASD